MKIIHCADLHLNSKMTSNLAAEKAKERKAELLNTFIKMVEFAVENDVRAIIIAGDLFDQNQITQTTRNAVYNQIKNNPGLDFYYLQGNHDSESFLSAIEEMPANLKLFGDKWTTYALEGKKLSITELNSESSWEEATEKTVKITGVELNGENCQSVYNSLILDAACFNIVVMHGQESEKQGKDKTEVVALNSLRNKGIDYLALGHIHKYKAEKLDGRGTYCYCGCLEGRGFDECGEHGFVLLDIDEDKGTFTHTFVPFAARRLYEVCADISGCLTSEDIKNRIDEVLNKEQIAPENMVKIILTGEADVDCEKNTDLLCKQLGDKFYFLKIYDESKWKVDYLAYALDVSLKGEFVRAVSKAEDISEEDKAAVIRYGIQALAGEELQ